MKRYPLPMPFVLLLHANEVNWITMQPLFVRSVLLEAQAAGQWSTP